MKWAKFSGKVSGDKVSWDMLLARSPSFIRRQAAKFGHSRSKGLEDQFGVKVLEFFTVFRRQLADVEHAQKAWVSKSSFLYIKNLLVL